MKPNSEEKRQNSNAPTKGVNVRADEGESETFNLGLTAIPKDLDPVDEASSDEDLIATEMDFGEMNEADARASGYTDKRGHAASLAKKDKIGSPTGAYTDVGAGRSSAVISKTPHK